MQHLRPTHLALALVTALTGCVGELSETPGRREMPPPPTIDGATPMPLPGVDALRPVQQSPVWNLQLAGDWTRTGWPATMEGAVRSGYLAAENVLGHLGRPDKIVQPDLPVSRLSRFLLGL